MGDIQWEPVGDESRWDDLERRIWPRWHETFDWRRYRLLVVAVVLHLVDLCVRFAGIFERSDSTPYISGGVVAVLILAWGLLMPRTMLVLVGAWALLKLGFLLTWSWRAETVLLVILNVLAFVVVLRSAPWRVSDPHARREGALAGREARWDDSP